MTVSKILKLMYPVGNKIIFLSQSFSTYYENLSAMLHVFKLSS